jgi:cell wall-associated NlpC family hydrolase
MKKAFARLGRAGLLSAGLLAASGHLSPARAGGVYFVKEGDTLSSIGRVFAVTPAQIMAANGLADAALGVGDRLRIPEASTVPAPRPAPAARAAATDARVRELVCREEKVYHEVAKGDTLAAISRRYSAPLDDLLRLNSLRRTSRLAIGQRILVRRSGPQTHVVRRGETLRSIALRSRVPLPELRRLNQLDGDRLAPGQRLQLEPCEQFAVAGGVPTPPPVSGATAAQDAAGLLTAMAAAAAEASADSGDGQPAPVTTAERVGADGVADRVIGLAKTMLDIPYRFGGTTLRGIDCSAYVQRVFSLIDVELPRTAREQYGIGERVGRDDLSIGDLVFFRTYASFPSHVGIYIGENLFIHASSVVRKVTIDSLDRPYYTKRFLGGRRLVAEDPQAAQLTAAPK